MRTSEENDARPALKRHRLDREKSSPAYRTRLRWGKFVAEIVPETGNGQAVYHLIVQQLGSPTIICLSQESTFCGALEKGHVCLSRLLRGKSKRERRALYEFGGV